MRKIIREYPRKKTVLFISVLITLIIGTFHMGYSQKVNSLKALTVANNFFNLYHSDFNANNGIVQKTVSTSLLSMHRPEALGWRAMHAAVLY
ncbi:MAG: hypothetical protein K9I29_08030, partial [Bacteroidales bacterium]|nr:hypothetical protein [Bacteroidales bacterium]